MSNIECFMQIEFKTETQEIIEDLTTSPTSSYTDELIMLYLQEDQLNNIPASTIEVHHIGSHFFLKQKGRLHKRDENIEARSISYSTIENNPIEFFKALGYSQRGDAIKRDAIRGDYDGITIVYYFGSALVLEAHVLCQLSELEDSILRLKDLKAVVLENYKENLYVK